MSKSAPSIPSTEPLASSQPAAWRAWVVYLVGVFAYIIAIMQRTTLGVAGVAAAERFAVDAALLSSLGVLQLAVYALMQIPVGILIDRIGSRKLLIIGTAIMLVGQVLVGFAPDLLMAVIGRILVGGGDAMIFASLVRLTAAWFSGSILSSLFQWIGSLGQIGQVLSAVPFAWLLNQSGWTTAFLSAAACSVLALIALLIGIPRGTPQGAATRSDRPPQRSWQLLRQALADPGARLGFWTTWTAQCSGFMFMLMWGFPFMVHAMGQAPNTAAQLLVVTVVTGAVAGPLLGLFSARHPTARNALVFSIVSLQFLVWTLMLAWPSGPPLWTLLALLIVMGVAIPSGVFGFDHALETSEPECLGSANGIVNMGGFVPAVLLILLIGLLLDAYQKVSGLPGDAGLYSMAGFRRALLVQYPIAAFGAWRMWALRRQMQRAAHQGPEADHY